MLVAKKLPSNYDQEWQDFSLKISTYAQDPPEKWTVYTLLSYFLYRYQQANQLDFVFAHCKKGPTQSKEMRDAAKIWKMFDQNRYQQLSSPEDKLTYKLQLVDILKAYIDWAFAVKFRGRQTNVTGLGLFAVAGFM